MAHELLTASESTNTLGHSSSSANMSNMAAIVEVK